MQTAEAKRENWEDITSTLNTELLNVCLVNYVTDDFLNNHNYENEILVTVVMTLFW